MSFFGLFQSSSKTSKTDSKVDPTKLNQQVTTKVNNQKFEAIKSNSSQVPPSFASAPMAVAQDRKFGTAANTTVKTSIVRNTTPNTGIAPKITMNTGIAPNPIPNVATSTNPVQNTFPRMRPSVGAGSTDSASFSSLSSKSETKGEPTKSEGDKWDDLVQQKRYFTETFLSNARAMYLTESKSIEEKYMKDMQELSENLQKAQATYEKHQLDMENIMEQVRKEKENRLLYLQSKIKEILPPSEHQLLMSEHPSASFSSSSAASAPQVPPNGSNTAAPLYRRHAEFEKWLQHQLQLEPVEVIGSTLQHLCRKLHELKGIKYVPVEIWNGFDSKFKTKYKSALSFFQNDSFK